MCSRNWANSDCNRWNIRLATTEIDPIRGKLCAHSVQLIQLSKQYVRNCQLSIVGVCQEHCCVPGGKCTHQVPSCMHPGLPLVSQRLLPGSCWKTCGCLWYRLAHTPAYKDAMREPPLVYVTTRMLCCTDMILTKSTGVTQRHIERSMLYIQQK